MLVELAVADAYGNLFEMKQPDFVAENNHLTGYLSGTGYYTDDTQMSLAVTEAILSGKPWGESLLARKFVEAYQRDPHGGYAYKFGKFLSEVVDGPDFLARIHNNSIRNGGAMRAGPIGIFPTVAEVIAKSDLQAQITHNTVEGRSAAIGAALMTHYFLYERGPKANLGHFLNEHVTVKVSGLDWTVIWQGRVGLTGPEAVQAAVTAIVRNDSRSSLLKDCIGFSGDVDTVAAIAMAAAAHSSEIKADLPQHLYDKLEDGRYGHQYIKNLDKQLLEMHLRLKQGNS
jgi:ADP-ribosyl-[dinitrogen reductase] hydrolase